MRINVGLFIITSCLAVSCNTSGTSDSDAQQHNASIPKTQSDSLYKATMEGHDIGMAKMGEMIRYQNLLKQKADSLSRIKSKDNQIGMLDSALQNLNRAEEQMNQWMQQFEPDKAGETEAQKILFYKSEKEKIDSVNASILQSIDKAKKALE